MSVQDSLCSIFCIKFVVIAARLPSSTNYSGQHLLTCDQSAKIYLTVVINLFDIAK
jgi:hypothetical protein